MMNSLSPAYGASSAPEAPLHPCFLSVVLLFKTKNIVKNLTKSVYRLFLMHDLRKFALNYI